ncbi:MAG: DUF58 domain-containing protein, partial [Haloarculaceae archaeon]
VGEHVDRETGRWRGLVGFALLSGALGALVGRGAPVVAGAVALSLAAYARTSGAPPVDVEVSRELSRTRVEPGTSVRVAVTVRNVGSTVLPDLRVVDGVPEGLAVADGSPRHGTALRPGRSATFAYTVTARRGAHEWEPVTALALGFAGSVEREARIEGPTSTLTCVPGLTEGPSLPLRPHGAGYAGRLSVDDAGAGVEFRSVREYRPGDPLARVDWHRVARTGELSTVEFARERAAEVVLVVDTRAEAYVAPDRDAPSAVERSVAAAGRAFTSLLATGDRVGIASFGPRECWLPPGAGADHRARARDLLATHPAFAPAPPEEPFAAGLRVRALRRLFPAAAQVVLFSPCTDDYAVRVARRLDAHGHPVTVVAPDPTTEGTAGRELARAERAVRLSELRRGGLRSIDWGDEPLATAVQRASRRWSG